MCTETDHIFQLLDCLKKKRPFSVAKSGQKEIAWRVHFKGAPSYRHANRIGIFRDFLDSLLPGEMETIAARPGSVIVDFAPPEATSCGEYVEMSKALIADQDKFTGLAKLLGVSSLQFDGQILEF